MEKPTPSYWSVIPADVRHDDQISANAKIFYAEITSLTNQGGYCWAGNDYFMDAFKFSDRTVTRLISELEKAGYIFRQMIKDSDGKVMQRRIFLRESALHGLPPDKIGGWCQNCQDPPDKIGGENNISSDNKKKILKEKTPKPKAESLTDEQLQEIFKDWINEIAPEGWSREIKNRLWMTLCDFYKPRTVAKNNPERSVAGVNALKRQLMDYSEGHPEKMCTILDTAITRGYRGIIPLNDSSQKQPQKSEREDGVKWI